MPDAYANETFRRLRQIKSNYDPQNLFGGTLNIPPAG
ncbi:BBE domain-containing protein (plasmid) [Devosia sp. A8/3-2]|nr:BBE domain-containing protein [Devosia sp. A8/3-2]